MKPLYISAVVSFSGKTALTLGLGLKLQAAGHKVGYYKPISAQPFLAGGKVVDEDAAFVREALKLESPAHELSSVVMDDALLSAILEGRNTRDFEKEVRESYAKLSAGKDVLLVEGGASMREGYVAGLSTARLTEMLSLPTLGVIRYRDAGKLVDDALAIHARMGSHTLGVVVNAVPVDAMKTVNYQVAPFLEKHGVRVYGVLPHQQSLMSISVGELIGITSARVLNSKVNENALVENLSVGAMSVESALPRFRRTLHKAVITGGDRADLQAAALETSTVALILTGNLQPSSTIVQRAEELGVAVLMVSGSTIETVEAVDKVFGKTSLSSPAKLERFMTLLDHHLDTKRLFTDLGL